ncbi:MAG TPA: hypothetical protein VJC12_01845 [Candidatus Paceibacterota bacterium]
MGHLLRADAFVGDFVPPSDFVERRKRPRRNLTPAEEREERAKRMALPYPRTNRIALVLHSVNPSPEALVEDDEDMPDDSNPFDPLNDSGEIRIAALRDSSGEEPFAPQDMDAFGDPEVIPGLWPEEGFGIMTIEEMERHERVSNSVSLPTWPEHPSWKKEKH